MTMVVVAVNLVLMRLQTLAIWHEQENEVLVALVYHHIGRVLRHKAVVKNVLSLLPILL